MQMEELAMADVAIGSALEASERILDDKACNHMYLNSLISIWDYHSNLYDAKQEGRAEEVEKMLIC